MGVSPCPAVTRRVTGHAFPLGIFLLPLLGGKAAPGRANTGAEVTFGLAADEFRL